MKTKASPTQKQDNPLDRYDATYGPNSKQWWVYDSKNDSWIDPPLEVLEKVGEAGDEWTVEGVGAQRQALEEILKEGPDWLDDKDYTYAADEFDI